MWTSLRRVARPSADPVELDEAKHHLRVNGTNDDSLIKRLIRSAADQIEGPHGCGIAITQQQWDLVFDAFPSCIEIPLVPLAQVDSIKYIDLDAVEQTLSSATYEVDVYRGRVRPVSGSSWPSTKTVFNAVSVRFTCGYSDVPEDLKAAVLLIVGDRYAHREDTITGTIVSELPSGVAAILNSYRVGRFA